jgi:methylenetetrahydromethanopterin dehydrogenase
MINYNEDVLIVLSLSKKQMVLNITVVKTGFLAVTTLIEALLDERASRKDISIRSVSSGAKMNKADIDAVEQLAKSIDTDLFIVVSPNASLDGPKNLALNLGKLKPTILISDNPATKIIEELKGKIGYIIIQADPLIGIRKEFLDPIEMSNFNSDVIKVLSITGAFSALIHALDSFINESTNGNTNLPNIIIDKHQALKHSGLSNPYAKSKALASYEMARLVGRLSAEGGYKEKDREKYLLVVSASHELIRQAAKLADEARELEKENDTVHRNIHDSSGKTLTKKKFFDTL